MKTISAQQLDRSLADGLPSVAIVSGEEAVLQDQAIDRLVHDGLGNGLADFNLDRFDGDTLDVDALLTARVTLPMMSERRVILVRHLERLHSARRRKLLEALATPCDSALVVLSATALTQAEVNRAGKIEGAIHIKADRPKERDAMRQIESVAQEHGVRLDSEAAAALLETRRVKGGAYDLTGITVEMEKLALYADGRGTITVTDVRAIVADTGQSTIFELTDAIVAGDLSGALGILDHLYRQGDDPISVVTMTHRHFSLLWRTSLLQDTLRNPSELAKELGVPSFFVRRYIQQTRSVNLQRLPAIFRELLQADLELKSSAGGKDARRSRGRLLVTRITSAAGSRTGQRSRRVQAR